MLFSLGLPGGNVGNVDMLRSCNKMTGRIGEQGGIVGNVTMLWSYKKMVCRMGGRRRGCRKCRHAEGIQEDGG